MRCECWSPAHRPTPWRSRPDPWRMGSHGTDFKHPEGDMLNVVRVVLFPFVLIAAIAWCCYEVFWYCAIVGRPRWLSERFDGTPLTAVRDLLRDAFIPHRLDLRTCCGHCWGNRKCVKCPVHGRR